MEKVVEASLDVFGFRTQLNTTFRVLDLGCGIGKPLWHFAERRTKEAIKIIDQFTEPLAF